MDLIPGSEEDGRRQITADLLIHAIEARDDLMLLLLDLGRVALGYVCKGYFHVKLAKDFLRHSHSTW